MLQLTAELERLGVVAVIRRGQLQRVALKHWEEEIERTESVCDSGRLRDGRAV